MRITRLLAVLALALTGIAAVGPPAAGETTTAAAVEPVGAPGDTSWIQLVTAAVQDGWRFTTYRNLAYPCAISGYQTFTIGTRQGEDPDAVRPLWVFLHGGGVGWFSPDGTPRPSRGQKVEESPQLQRSNALDGTLKGLIGDHPAGFRMMAVSMCGHDIYAGPDVADPNNPNRLPDGAPRTVNGLFATKAAVQVALGLHPTDDLFLHGGSAGSYGSYTVGWGLEEMGITPAGIVADSGVMNIAWQPATILQPTDTCGRGEEAAIEIPERLHPDVTDPANGPDRLIADGRLTAPVIDVFSVGDRGQCGETPIDCTVGDETITLGSVECMHEPVRRAIEAQGDDSRSLSMDLCVRSDPPPAEACATHTPANKPFPNTRAPWPADFQPVIVDWVTDRLADDGAGPPRATDATTAFAIAAQTDLLGGTTARQVEAAANALGAGQSKATFLGRLTTSDAWLTGIVEDLYVDTLGRAGDAGGTAYWVGELASGRRTVAQVAASFYASPEHYDGLGGGTDATWIADLYAKVLGRSAEPGGVGYWSDEVARTGRTPVALRFHQTSESARVRVTGLYQALLGRAPSTADLDFWAPRVVARGDLVLAVSLAASIEYQAQAELRFPLG